MKIFLGKSDKVNTLELAVTTPKMSHKESQPTITHEDSIKKQTITHEDEKLP